MPPVWKKSFDCEHLIPCWPVQPLICTELLFVSDHATQSHYRLKDARNTGMLLSIPLLSCGTSIGWFEGCMAHGPPGAEKVGEIMVDFTFLRDQGWLEPTEPGTNSKGRPVGRRHYKVEYEIEIEVVDRDLKCKCSRSQGLVEAAGLPLC